MPIILPLIAFVWLLLVGAVHAQPPWQYPATDYPAQEFVAPSSAVQYQLRSVNIPMRDGIELHTHILIPNGLKNAPMVLTRTPYDAQGYITLNKGMQATDVVSIGMAEVLRSGYIWVIQDIRGRMQSGGDFLLYRPLRGPLNRSLTDEATDAHDTVAWLSRNVPESNGAVAIMGTSYDGFLSTAALFEAHPALKAVIPVNPATDGWLGDDWFHYGAHRNTNLDFLYVMTKDKESAWESIIPREFNDDYDGFLQWGSIGDFARRAGLEQLPFWQRTVKNPSYNEYWQEQALDRLLRKRQVAVPTLAVASLWDAEDIYGPYAVFDALQRGASCTKNNAYLAMGPWKHGGDEEEGSGLGPLRFATDTAAQYRRTTLIPFLDQHLKADSVKADLPRVHAYESGTDQWRKLDTWPLACEQGCQFGMTAIYLGAQGRLHWQTATSAQDEYDEYVSDPAKPVPYLPRPIRLADHPRWSTWLTSDQRVFTDRPDVLTYISEPLKEPVRIAGAPVVNLFAATTGTDADWVVKVIDAFPQSYAQQPEMGGYMLPIAMDIFRGRYRQDFSQPQPLASGETLEYRFKLPNAHHVFRPGHRIVIQIQSSWFPLYDRNPQTFVDNIFFAQASDYRKATHRIFRSGLHASRVDLPIVAAGAAGQAMPCP
jgi:uncharacterized protein